MRLIKDHKCCYHNTGYYIDPENPDVHNNNVENLWRLTKGNTLRSRFKVTPKYLQQYNDETCFRINHQHKTMMAQFDRLVECCVGRKIAVGG
jgi:hypothetical protein